MWEELTSTLDVPENAYFILFNSILSIFMETV